VSIIAPVNPSG